mgnify:CR=1 FL=1
MAGSGLTITNDQTWLWGITPKETFYNPIRLHGYAANLAPVNYERQYFLK